ncbi:hypothetical protein [Bacillus chungangensis]|uniref:MFS family permease n=1 Tax=Bacillus chungangensis TaxID=587633 RepID=A0ABT9WQ57_9BACI|nr:hypothetical protein [Bacillus chungangensis]MDQ0175306.1 MFS family permease [Bacillus chungangensis]
MMNEPIVAAVLIFALLMVGEVLSIVTRARVPMLFVVFFGYLILLWTGLFPLDIIDRTGLSTFGALMVAPLIVHMGTLIPLKVMKQQYKAVFISLMGIVITTITVLLVVTPILGYEIAVSGVGPLTGGIIAFIITSEKLQMLGLTTLIVIPALVLALQNLIGLPLAINFLRRYAYKIREQAPVNGSADDNEEGQQLEEKQEKKSLMGEKFSTPIILLFQLFFGGALAVLLGKWTGINYSLWALAIGFSGMLIGFYKDKMMERANSFGIAMAGLIFFIIPSMNDVTFSSFIQYLPSILLILGIGAVGIIAGGYIGSKLFKWDPFLGIPVALTAMFGFPGDYIICEEISRTTGRNEAERKYIFDQLISPLLIGGFTTVTIASVIVASVLMGTLG